MAKPRLKISRTHTPWVTRAFGHDIVLPIGTVVTNRTACGPDDAYRFVRDHTTLAKQITGLIGSTLEHDLKHRGLNVPAEFCEPYEQDAPSKPVPVKNWLFVTPPTHVSDDRPEYLLMVLEEEGEDLPVLAAKARRKLAAHLSRELDFEVRPDELLVLAATRTPGPWCKLHLTMGDEVFVEVPVIRIPDEAATV